MRLDTTPSGMMAFAFSHPSSRFMKARMTEESITDLVTVAFFGRLASPIGNELVDEADAFRDEAADDSLRPTHCFFHRVDTQFVFFHAGDELVSHVHSQGGTHRRGNNDAPA